MNQSNLQQPKKDMGLVAQLLALFAMGNIGAGKLANDVLVNGHRGHIPGRLPNQRQRRKRMAQTR